MLDSVLLISVNQISVKFPSSIYLGGADFMAEPGKCIYASIFHSMYMA